ncbi:MAG: PH domain-containing protein [Alphaproteobacteria bacterium]|nr:PH domain-containing protein [Alphaproteobacteria bacterium]
MSYVNKMLLPDERIIYIATIHWIIFIPGLILTAIGGIGGYYAYEVTGLFVSPSMLPVFGKMAAGAAFVCSLAGLGLLIGAFIRQTATELAVTNRRIVAKYGFISRSTFEIINSRITGVNFDQSIMGRLFGYGTILVHGAGGDLSPFDVIAHPQLFQRALMDEMEHGRNR